MASSAPTARSKEAPGSAATAAPHLVAMTRPWVTRSTPAFLAQVNTRLSRRSSAALLVVNVRLPIRWSTTSPVSRRSTRARASARVRFPVWVSLRPSPTNSARRRTTRGWERRPGTRRPRRRRASGSVRSTFSAAAAPNSDLAMPEFDESPMASTNSSVSASATCTSSASGEEPGASRPDAWRKAMKAPTASGMGRQSAGETLSVRGHQSSRKSATSSLRRAASPARSAASPAGMPPSSCSHRSKRASSAAWVLWKPFSSFGPDLMRRRQLRAPVRRRW